MRALVFLPPPTLARLNTDGRFITIPIFPPWHASHAQQHRTTQDQQQTSVQLEETDEVPDSVDPSLPPIGDDVHGEESIARSVVEDAPLQVAWELLDPTPHLHTQDHPGKARRPAKRVRIDSPVLVIATPERAPPLTRPLADGIEAEEGADRSWIVLGEASDSNSEERSYNNARSQPSREHGLDEGDQQESDTSLDKSRVVLGDDSVNYHEDSVTRGDSTSVLDRSFLFGLPTITASLVLDGELCQTSNNASDSSLQIRAPVAGSRPALTATCKFSFFSKRSTRPSTTFFAIASPTSTAAAEKHESREQNDPHQQQALALARSAARTRSNRESSIQHALPEMNDHNATLAFSLPTESHPDLSSHHASLMGGASIVPPPTLHFTLGSITPVSRILAFPQHFLSSTATNGSRTGMFASVVPGAVSSRVNLLVVVKQVGEVQRVRCRFPVDKPALVTEMSKAFSDAMPNERLGAAASGSGLGWMGDGKTERVELVVMDGRMSSIKRLLPSSESTRGEWKLVQEVAEKCLFKVVVWGKLAREWTTHPHPLSTPSELKTTLHPGDVIHLENLSLTPTHKPPRLGSGFPPRIPHQQKLPLTAQASQTISSKIHLCYRTHLQNTSDANWNFHPDIAHFDLNSRRVLELSRLWKCSIEKRY